MLRVGLISDTHGLVRPQAIDFLRGCDRILHAGDVGDPGVLRALGEIAPVTAVLGNNDTGAWAMTLRETELLQLEDVFVHVIHDLADLDLAAPRQPVRVVVSGHSHKPRIEERAGVLYVNPGSAGPRRFKLPIAVGELAINGQSVQARIAELPISKQG